MTGEITFARVPASASGLRLSSTDWAVLHAICLHADRGGVAFPGMARIAAITGLKRKNLPRSIARLERHNLLKRRRMPRGKGWGATGYQVLFAPAGSTLSNEDIRTAGAGNNEANASEVPLTPDGIIVEDVLNGEDTAPEAVLEIEDTKGELSSAVRTQGVLNGEAIPSDGCPQNATKVSSNRNPI